MASLADEDRIVYQEVCAQLTAISENLCLPKPNEKVHKNECIYCFRNPFFPGNFLIFLIIIICLRRFICLLNSVCRSLFKTY